MSTAAQPQGSCVELRQSENEGSSAMGGSRAERADPAAIRKALYSFLKDRLG